MQMYVYLIWESRGPSWTDEGCPSARARTPRSTDSEDATRSFPRLWYANWARFRHPLTPPVSISTSLHLPPANIKNFIDITCFFYYFYFKTIRAKISTRSICLEWHSVWHFWRFFFKARSRMQSVAITLRYLSLI